MDRLPRLPRTTLRGPRPLPMLGATFNLIRFFGDPIRWLLEIHGRYGALATLADRDPAVVCAFGAEYNRAILGDSKRFENFADLPVPAPPGSAALLLNRSLTAENGEVHRRHRRLMMPAFNRESVEGHGERMASVIERRCARLQAGARIDMAAETQELALCVAMECLFGVDVSHEADSLGSLALRFLRGLTSPLTLVAPVRLPGLPYRAFLDVAERLAASLRGIVRERRQGSSHGRDVLSILIAAHDDDGTRFDEDELIGQAMVLFIASHETTAQTLAWTLFLLSQHPEVMRALGEELHARLGGAPPTVSRLGELELLDRVVKESMRLLPATPFLFMRRATEPFALDGLELPARAIVLLSSLITHRLPERFPEPARFRPERWRGLDPTIYEYLPFGAGPRMCIGALFAGQAIRVALATLLQRVHVELLPEARVSRKVQGITFGPKYGMPMRLLAPGERVVVPARVRGDIGELVDLRASGSTALPGKRS